MQPFRYKPGRHSPDHNYECRIKSGRTGADRRGAQPETRRVSFSSRFRFAAVTAQISGNFVNISRLGKLQNMNTGPIEHLASIRLLIRFSQPDRVAIVKEYDGQVKTPQNRNREQDDGADNEIGPTVAGLF